jgi:hypothetical protein
MKFSHPKKKGEKEREREIERGEGLHSMMIIYTYIIMTPKKCL